MNIQGCDLFHARLHQKPIYRFIYIDNALTLALFTVRFTYADIFRV
jgi:hypothetical protein